jgi:cobalamin biosynthesis protein CbiD
MIPQNKSSKTQINVNEESMQKLMQETYNEIVDERNKALILYKRVTKDIDSNSDIALIGKVANDLLKIMDGAVEKKLKLIKLQSDILYKTAKTDSSPDNFTMTDEDKKWAEEMLEKQKNKDLVDETPIEKSYDL